MAMGQKRDWTWMLFSLVQGIGMLPYYTQSGLFLYSMLFFSPCLVLLESMPVACGCLNFLHPVISHWIHSFLLWNTQHSLCSKSKHFFEQLSLIGAADNLAGTNLCSILCILAALWRIMIIFCTIDLYCLTKHEVWGRGWLIQQISKCVHVSFALRLSVHDCEVSAVAPSRASQPQPHTNTYINKAPMKTFPFSGLCPSF